MHGQRHLHIQGSGPEPVVLRQRIGHAIRKRAEHNALKAERSAVLQLLKAILAGRHRHDPEPDEALGIHSTVFLAQPVIVGPYGGEVGGIVGDVAPQPWSSLHVREEYLGGAAVLLLLAQALLGRANTRGVLDAHAKWLPVLSRAPGAEIQVGYLEERGALNLYGIAPVRMRHSTRHLVAVRGRHSTSPALWEHFQMRVT